MKRIWSIDTESPLVGMPVSSGGMVVVIAESGTVSAVSLHDGSPVWTAKVSNVKYGVTPPTLTAQHVFFGLNASVYCLDRATGVVQWSSMIGVPSTEVISHRDAVCTGTEAGTFHALHRSSGRLIWSLATKDPIAVCSEISRRPALSGIRVVFGSNNFKLYCVSVLNGELLWTVETTFWVQTAPLILDDTVYVASHTEMHALRIDDGSLLWKFEKARGELVASAANNELLVICDSQNTVYCLDRRSGGERWRLQLSAPSMFDPSICSGKVFIPSYDEHVHCVDLATGRIEWSISAENPSSCALVDDKLLFNNRVGYRYGSRLECYESGVQGPIEWPMPRQNAASTGAFPL